MPIDEEVLNRVYPEEPTELEREWMDKIGVDEFSVYLTKLELTCEEAKQNMRVEFRIVRTPAEATKATDFVF